MSGPFGSSSGGSFSFGQQPATTQPVSLFGSNAATSAGGFAFGSSTPTTFGKPQQTTQPSSFSFSTPAQTSTFGFGSQTAQQPATFASPPAQTTAFGGQPQTTPFGATTGLNFGGGSVFSPQSTAAPVLGFGAPAIQSTTGFGGFTTSTPSTTGQTGFTFGSLAAGAAGAAAASTAPNVTFGQQTAANQLTGSSLFKTGASIAPTPQVENQVYGGANIIAPATTTVSGLNFGSMAQPSGYRANTIQPTFGTPTQQTTVGFGGMPQQTTVGFGATTQPSSVSFGTPVQPNTVTFGTPVQQSAAFGATTQPTTVPFGTPTQPSALMFGTPTQPSSVGFGATTPVQPNAGSIFGQSMASSEATTTAPSVFGQSLVAAPSVTPASVGVMPTASMFGQTTQSVPVLGAVAPAAPVYQFGTPITSVSASVPTVAGTGTVTGISGFSGLSGGIKMGGAVTSVVQPVTTSMTPMSTSVSGISMAAPANTVVSTASTTPITGYTFPSLAKTTAPTTTAEAAPAFSLGSAATSAASIASTSGFSLTSNTSIGSTSTGLATSVATTTAVSSSTLPTTGMNFRQLEETINKWTVELEEQEKIYLNQATQVNAWDRMLIKNGEKITQLNDSLERVKLEQQHLEHEIDFILAQQKELEDLLLPLEQHVDQTPTLSVQHHADLEREHTYQLAENIDAQMKRMAEDLKEIIDHVNTSNNNQDNTDPVYQVGKILNAHMDSLQWIEQNTNLVQRKLEEVSQLYEVRRKDQERRFRLAYE